MLLQLLITTPKVKRRIVTPPYGMGDWKGRWSYCDDLMQYTVLQAQSLVNRKASGAGIATAFSQKRSSEGLSSGSHEGLKKQKQQIKQQKSANAGSIAFAIS